MHELLNSLLQNQGSYIKDYDIASKMTLQFVEVNI